MGNVDHLALEQQRKSQHVRSKYLVFRLGSERFGVALSAVKEVIGLPAITQVPQVPKYFKGLINLRGRIISVIDLRLKLQLPESAHRPKETSIIISEIGDLVLGVIVDDVEEVASYEESQIENNLELQSKVGRDYLQGVAKTVDQKIVLLLNISQVLNVQELEVIKKNSK